MLGRVSIVMVWAATASLAAGGQAGRYDPLAVAGAGKAGTRDLTVPGGPDGRELPLRVYLPACGNPAPVVLFSHGLGGSCRNNPYLGEHWARRGYVVVFVQHPGSDEGVWRDTPRRRRLAAMQKAASGRNFILRVQDVPRVLDRLAAWNAEAGHPLAGRMDLDRVGMSGHSFGAVTTQAVSGQSFGRLGRRFTDGRIDAAVAFSPSPPRRGDPGAAFAKVSVPWMVMTGTEDESIIGGLKAADRLKVYPRLPATIDRYELVLHEAEHSAFSQRALPGDRRKRNPNHHRAILALTTAFWDAHLRGSDEARAWLHGEGPRGVLEPKDRWRAAEGDAGAGW